MGKVTHQFDCPHCGNSIGAVPRKKSEAKTRLSGNFEHSVATIPPKGRVSKLLWFMRGNKFTPEPTRPAWGDMTLTVETFNHADQQVTLQGVDGRIKLIELFDLAVMIITNDHSWTRSNIRKHTRLTVDKIRTIQEEFKRLGYLEVSSNNRSSLTTSGKLLLRGVLSMSDPPTAHPP